MIMKYVELRFLGRRYEVPQGTTKIGRAPDNDVRIFGDTNVFDGISGYHCKLHRSSDEVIVEDLRSRNGTYVNEHRIEKCVLRNGDRMSLGENGVRIDVRIRDRGLIGLLKSLVGRR